MKKRTVRKWGFIKILAAMLIISMLGNAGIAQAENMDGGGNTYTKVLFKDNKWNGGKPAEDKRVRDGDIISVNDTLIMEYFFALSEENVRAIDANQDKKYELKCPEGLVWVAGDKEELYFQVEDSDEGIHFATLQHETDENGKVIASVTFVENLLEKAPEGIQDIFVYLGCQLDGETLGVPNGPGTHMIELGEGNSLNISIAENQPRASKLGEKEGAYSNGTFTWTLTYQPGKDEDANTLPLTLVDEFDATYHDYKDGSFQVVNQTNNQAIPLEPDSLTIGKKVGNESVTQITYTIPEEITKGIDPITIIYETTLTDAGLTSTQSREVLNEAWLIDRNGTPVGEKVSGKTTFEAVDWLRKEIVDEENGGGLQQENDGRKYFQWKVTVKTNSKDLDKLILHDSLQDENGHAATDYAKIDINTIQIFAYRGGQSVEETTNSGHTIVNEGTEGKGFALTFHTTDSGYTLADEYVVTYKTYLNEDYYHGGNDIQFKNQAYLDYDWKTGPGEGDWFHPEPPTVETPFGIDGRMIRKEGVGYNPSTHEITWRVVVNPHRLNLEYIEIQDPIKTFGQTYVSETGDDSDVDGSFELEGTATDKPTVTLPAENDETGMLTVRFDNVGANTYTYIFKTTIDDPLDYGYNLPAKVYSNTVSAEAELRQENGTTKPLSASATGTCEITSNVLQKKAEGYDYNDNTIGWEFVVNSNRMPMNSDAEGVLLTDELAKGLTYYKDSIEVRRIVKNEAGGESEEPFDGITLEVVGDGQTKPQKLIFKYDKDTVLNDKLHIRLHTKVAVDEIESFKTEKEIKISNEVVLKRADYGDVKVSDEQNIGNNILAKKGEYDKDSDTIKYTVNINPHGITMKSTDESLENVVIRDDLPEGLQIDRDTIKLYKATVKTVDNQPVFEQGEEVDLKDTLTVNVLERYFEIELSKENTPYILEYIADVIDPGKTPFHNKIALKGIASGETGGTSEDIDIGSGGGGGGGTASSKVNLTLTKTDAMRAGIVLKGATFEMFEKDGDHLYPINKAATGDDGTVVFKSLKRGKTYVIEEVTAPQGYRKLEQPIEVPISVNKEETPKDYVYPAVTNQPVTGSLSVVKKNDLGRVLEGAEFTLTDTTAGSTWNQTAVSSADGTVTFTEIPYGTHILKETKAPDYHELNGTEYQVEVDENGKVTLTNSSDADDPQKEIDEIINVVQKASITIKKMDRDSKEPLKDVEFTLYDSDEQKIGEGKTDETGIILFDNLEVGRDYTIRENVPNGYAAEVDTQSIHLSEDGVTLEWENYRAGDVTITIEDDENQTPLPDVQWGIWPKNPQNPNETWEDVKDKEPSKTVKSDKNGKIRFEDLPAGEYWMYMMDRPEGYEEDGHLMVVNVSFDAQGKPVIKITNSETGEEIKDGVVGITPKPVEPEQTPDPENSDPTPEEPEPKPDPNPNPGENPDPNPNPEDEQKPSPEIRPEGDSNLESEVKPETVDKGSEAATEEAGNFPSTGDGTPWMWVVAAVLLSGGAVIATLIYRIYRKNADRKK